VVMNVAYPVNTTPGGFSKPRGLGFAGHPHYAGTGTG
jgi:hypothetical protein